MSYRNALIIIKFNMSSFEQYEPSGVSMEINPNYGEEGCKKLSESDMLHFLSKAKSAIEGKYIELEINRRAAAQSKAESGGTIANRQ